MKLKDCCAIIAGQSPESSSYNMDGIGLPFFQGKTEFGELYPTIKNYCSQPKKIAEKDDILLSVRAPIGPTNLSPTRVCIGRGLSAIRPDASILSIKYLLHFFRYIEKSLSEKGTGTTFKAITQDVVKNIEVPVIPLKEQKRIVNKIEELFSELDSAVETLKKTKEQLVVYRQSVLKEAFEGNFTEVWRKRNKIQKDWMAAPIQGFIKKEKNSLKAGPFGSALKKEFYVPSGYKVYGQEQVIAGDETIGDYYINQAKYEDLISCKVAPNDVLISLVGTVGKVLVLSPKCEAGIINPRLIKISLDSSKMLPYFFKYYFESGYLKSLYKQKVHGETMDVLNMGMIKELPFPSCSVDEQREVLKEIGRHFSLCENIEKTVNDALIQADAMRQSILKKAFEGGI